MQEVEDSDNGINLEGTTGGEAREDRGSPQILSEQAITAANDFVYVHVLLAHSGGHR